MPPADQQRNQLLRELLYGPAKVKKTWWAMKAAEAGFNVILLDGDDGSQIISQIDAATRSRIQVINIVDKTDTPVMCQFIVRLLTGDPFIWDEQDKSILLRAESAKEDHSYYVFDISKLTSNDVIVLDSWSAFCWSIAWRWYKENNIKVADAEQVKSELWPGYRWTGAMASWVLTQLKTLNCHVILIGHQMVFEKKKDEMVNGKLRPVVQWSRTQVRSTSGPHGMTLADAFVDILYFNVKGSRFTIDTSIETDRDGGCRFIKPGNYRWEDLQFIDIIEDNGLAVPYNLSDEPCEAAMWYSSGKDLPVSAVPVKSSGIPIPSSGGKVSFGNLLRSNTTEEKDT